MQKLCCLPFSEFLLLFLFSLSAILSCESKRPPPAETHEIKEKLFIRHNYQRTGINFINKLRESPDLNVLTFQYFANGGGVAIGDINNDDLPDVYFTGNQGPNRLYLNQGDFHFLDITKESGTDGGRGWTNGAVMVDINQDALLDIYVCRSGNYPEAMRANQLFINEGNNTFSERAEEFGLADPGYSTHSAFLDFDLDGDLDMYLLNHNVILPTSNDLMKLKSQYDPLAGDKFYENRDGRFYDISKDVGLRQNSIGYGLGVGVGDLDENGYPDIYVCNDYLEQDYLYLNSGDGRFLESLKERTGHTSNFSMGCDIADFNNDGLPDIFVADMAPEDNYSSKTNMAGMNPENFQRAVDNGFHYQYMINTFQLNLGKALFSEMGQLTGMAKTDWSWAPLFVDIDNDGWKDAIITNGYRMNTRNKDFEKKKLEYYKIIDEDPDVNSTALIRKILDLVPSIKVPNYVFKNDQNLNFQNKIEDWGFDESSFSNGIAYGDLDADGDLDLVINNIDQESFVYENRSKGNFLRFKLKGPETNPFGIGAKLILKYSEGQQYVENYSSRGYLSSMEPIVHFGLPAGTTSLDLEVIWSDKKSQTIKGLSPNQLLLLDYENAGKTPGPKEESKPVFEETSPSAGIDFKHEENPYDDFGREILLPHKMSALGPGLAVADVNNDGLEDFFIGNGAGFSPALYIQNSTAHFSRSQIPFWKKESRFEDMSSVFFDLDNDGDLDLYVVSGGSREKQGSPIYQDRIYLNNGQGEFSVGKGILPKIVSSGSCVVPGDFDLDGDLDLFVGGRVLPGKYPFAPKSYLLKNEKGKFMDVTSQMAPMLNDIGMVTSAVWMDINNDKLPDLILAGEWMPIIALENHSSGFITRKSGSLIENSQGWWFSLEKADLDNDGDFDLIAGNLGLNYKFRATPAEPFHIYSGDLDGSGTNDIYLGYFQEGQVFPVRGRECSSQQMPYIKEKFKTYSDFGKANIDEILGDALNSALHYEAKQFKSILIENLGDGEFQERPLPIQNQISAINGIVWVDINKDRIPDIITAGNMYGSEIETPRNDAGIGTVLISGSSWDYEVQEYTKSGFLANGDVKDLKLIHLANNKLGILVARNSGDLALIEICQ
jgi:enediyne biosynthesis protein E4